MDTTASSMSMPDRTSGMAVISLDLSFRLIGRYRICSRSPRHSKCTGLYFHGKSERPRFVSFRLLQAAFLINPIEWICRNCEGNSPIRKGQCVGIHAQMCLPKEHRCGEKVCPSDFLHVLSKQTHILIIYSACQISTKTYH